MQQNRKRRGRYFYRLLFSSLSIALVPIMALSALIYQLGIVRLREEISNGQRMLLEQASASLHARMEESMDIAYSISMDERVTQLSQNLPVYQIMEGIEQLERYLIANSFFSRIMVQRFDETILYTNKGTIDCSVLLNAYAFNAEDSLRFQQLVENGMAQLAFFDSAQIAMFFQPIPVFSRNPAGCAIFVIEQPALNALFPEQLQAGLSILLYHENGHLVSSRGAYAPTKEDAARLFHALADGTIATRTESFLLIAEQVPDIGWVFVSLVPESWLNARMRYVLIIGALSVCIAATLALVFLLTQRQYRPIYALSQRNDAVSFDADELASISQRLEQTDILNQQMEKHKLQLRESLLLRLLRGDTSNCSSIRSVLTEMNVFLHCEVFCVVLLHMHAAENTCVSPFLAQIEKALSARDIAYAVELTKSERVAVIVCIPAGNVRDMLEHLLHSLDLWLQMHIGARASFGIGMPHAFSDIASSYFEASVALDHALQTKQAFPSFFDDLKTPPQLDEEMQKKESVFLHALKEGAQENALLALDELLSLIRSRYADQPLMQYYRFRITESLVHFVSQEDLSGVDSKACASASSLLVKALSTGQMAQYEEALQGAVKILCALQQKKTAAMENDTINHVRLFMRNNIANPMLSLEMLAGQLGFSPSYWSNYFRETIGLPFPEYIWEMRLRLAKQLLQETDMPIKAIVAEIGYVDVSSFIRKFKQAEGLTPGQYRNLHS